MKIIIEETPYGPNTIMRFYIDGIYYGEIYPRIADANKIKMMLMNGKFKEDTLVTKPFRSIHYSS
jgi:hypothetical protein